MRKVVNVKLCMLRYSNFDPSFKLRWCRARDLFGSQIPVTTGGFELRIFCIRSRYLTHWTIRPNRLDGFGVPEFTTLRYLTLPSEFEINHLKSSGVMESAGAVEIFGHSVEKFGLIYNQNLSDGGSSSFKDVVNSNPYKEYNIIPEKVECVGHV